jgi:hypothetical protein
MILPSDCGLLTMMVRTAPVARRNLPFMSGEFVKLGDVTVLTVVGFDSG